MGSIKHTFAVCAYKESPYLEQCLKSVCHQTTQSKVIISTATPNDHIRNMAEKFEVELFINEGEAGIVQDWNYAYQMADTPYVTIAHQDDVYASCYAQKMLAHMKQKPETLIFFTNYGELRGKKRVCDNRLLKIKRLMLLPLRIDVLSGNIWVRRRILSMGNPICCPSVTFNKKKIRETPFEVRYRSDEDWQAWEKLSREKGDFVYDPDILMYHRIHEESETTRVLSEGVRTGEDYEMFCKFWPEFIARELTRLYGKGENSNSL